MSAAETDHVVMIDTATPKFGIVGVQDDDVNFFYDIPFSKPRVPPHRFALPGAVQGIKTKISIFKYGKPNDRGSVENE